MVDFTTNGKEVLLDGLHYADGRSHKAADLILAALTDRASIVAYLQREADNRKLPSLRRALSIMADNIKAGMDRADD